MSNNTDYTTLQSENSRFIDEMLAYKQDLIEALNNPDNNRDRMFMNDDRSRNAMIMSAMLDSCNKIIMYCGKMSVFRKNFYAQIDKTSEGAGKRAQKIMEASLHSFLKKKNKLTIILENFDKSYLEDLISDDLKNSELVSIKRIDKDQLLPSMLSHTALGMKGDVVAIKRRETNSDKYYARCMVNLNEDVAQDSMTLMSYIEEASYPIYY